MSASPRVSIWMDHVRFSCWFVCLFIYFSRSGRGRCPAHRKNNLWEKGVEGCVRRGGGRGYEYANHVTTWNLVMTGKYSRHISLCRGHCLMRAAGTMFPSFHSFSLSLSRSLSRSLSVLLFFMCSLSLSHTLVHSVPLFLFRHSFCLLFLCHSLSFSH